MYAVTGLSLLALAGSSLALPHYGYNNHVVYETKVVTVVVTPGASQPTPHPYSQAPYSQAPYSQAPPAKPTTTTVAPEPQPTSYYVAPAPSSTKTTSSSAAPAATDAGYMGVVNEWRQKLGLATLSHSDTLEANARKTCADGNGQMKHELNPGTNAQVLAPGSPSEFEKVFVGGWLCEKPNMAGMDGICNTMSSGWNYEGQTGHADILSSTSYTKIGCANVEGIWGCDLTY